MNPVDGMVWFWLMLEQFYGLPQRGWLLYFHGPNPKR